MTVTATTKRWEYTGDNSTTVFAYTNKIFADGDLTVTSDGSVQTLTTHYTVSGAGVVTGGNVTYVTAPATDVEVVIVRSLTDTQSTDYPAGGSLPSGVIEDDVDRRTIVSQQQQEELDRSLKYPSTDQSQPSATLPSKTTRASKFAAYDSDGAPIAAAGTSADLTPVSTFMDTMLDDADAATARATLVLGTAAVLDTGTGEANIPLVSEVLMQGLHTIFCPVACMQPTVSNGCSALTNVETTSGRPDMQVMDFATGADDHAQYQVAMPKSWNKGTITYRVFWTSTATDTDGVSWGLQAVAAADGDTIDVVYGTPIVVDDLNQSTAELIYVSVTSAALTIAGSPGADEMVFFRVFRDVSDGNDTAGEDARLIGVQLFITLDEGEDT